MSKKKGLDFASLIDEEMHVRLVTASAYRRLRFRRLAEIREGDKNFTQRFMGNKMGLKDGQAWIARFEAGGQDVKLSTLECYVSALGCQLEWGIVDSGGNSVPGFTSAELEKRDITFEGLGAEAQKTGL